MEDELYRWREMVKSKRESFYELNYFTTLQLLNLRREFGRLKNSSHLTAVVAPDMLTLLQSISTHVTPKVVSGVVFKVVQSGLSYMETTNATSSPQDDVMLSTGDGEAGNVRETKKSELNESQPEQGLSEKQKEMMANICSRLDCSKQLILKAFEACQGVKCDQYDYESWCVENMEKYSFLDGSSADEEDEGGQSETELVDDQQEFKYSQGVSNIPCIVCICIMLLTMYVHTCVCVYVYVTCMVYSGLPPATLGTSQSVLIKGVVSFQGHQLSSR